MKEFLQDSLGHLSSKRLGLICTLATAIISTVITLIVLLYKNKFDLAIQLIDSVWFATFGFAGVVASEFFKRNDKNNNN